MVKMVSDQLGYARLSVYNPIDRPGFPTQLSVHRLICYCVSLSCHVVSSERCIFGMKCTIWQPYLPTCSHNRRKPVGWLTGKQLASVQQARHTRRAFIFRLADSISSSVAQLLCTSYAIIVVYSSWILLYMIFWLMNRLLCPYFWSQTINCSA